MAECIQQTTRRLWNVLRTIDSYWGGRRGCDLSAASEQRLSVSDNAARPTDRFIVSGAVQRTERIIFSSVAGAHRVPVSHTYAAALYKRMVYNFCN